MSPRPYTSGTTRSSVRIQAEGDGSSWSDVEEDLFSEEFLLTRPLLEAIRAEDRSSCWLMKWTGWR
ncbi:MAG: hypothetical protein Ct9H300mP31_16900 [Acidimicrobiaceae bacterium]|nr:MAG: hypothetical protein Ct9H300mP31_16900 [Acidimicrobiaceae bacterium]